MPAVIYFVIIVGSICAALFVYLVNIIQRHKEYLKLIDKQAEKRNGQVKGGSGVMEPKLIFYMGPDTVGVNTRNGRYFTTFTYIDLRLSETIDLRMHIRVANPSSKKLGRLVGMKYIETGDQEFDNKIIIKGNDEEWIRKALYSQSMRQKILSSFPKFNLTFYLNGREMLITFNNYFRSDQDFDEVIDLLEELKNRIKNPEGF